MLLATGKVSKLIYLISITWGVLAQYPEPKANDKVLDNNPDQIGIWKYWVFEGKADLDKKPVGAKTRTNNKQTHLLHDTKLGS